MQKHTPTEFARLGFSCFIQSAFGDGELFLQVSSSSTMTAPGTWIDSYLLSTAPLNKKTDEQQQNNIAFEWFIEPSEEKGFFHLVSAADPKRPMLLHLGENFQQNGDPISIVEKHHAFEDTKIRFDEVPDHEGCYYMTFHKVSNMGSRTTDSKRVVHVEEETKNVTLFEKTSLPTCYWRILPAQLTPSDLINNSGCCFAIENKASGGFLNLKGGSIFNGTQIAGGPFANQANYKWRIKRAGSDEYFIISARDAHHDRALQQHENSQNDNAKITLWELDSNSKNSMVRFEPAQDDCWCIIICHSSKYLQLHLGELNQVGRKKNQPIDPSWCWGFVRCIPNFPQERINN